MENNIGKNEALNFIITLLKKLKNKEELSGDFEGRDYTIRCSDRYLLNQSLRRYGLENDKFFISVKAQELWDILFNDKNIMNYEYNDKIEVDNQPNDNVIIWKFSGSSNTPQDTYEVLAGQKIQYNDIFHDEHVVPIDDIIEELVKIENVDYNEETYKKVAIVLDKIYICKMLKSEDRRIFEPKKRKTIDVIKIVEKNYKQAMTRYFRGIEISGPIEIVDWEKIKKQIEEKAVK